MATRKYCHRGMVTRTIATTQADVTYYDRDLRELVTERYEAPGRLSKKQFCRALDVNGIVAEVDNFEVTSKLYAMPPEVFIQYAVEITDETDDEETEDES